MDWNQIAATAVSQLVSFGLKVFGAIALWMVGRTDALALLADPALDQGALELDVAQARARHARRVRPADAP